MMNDNIASAPYIIEINEPLQDIHLTDQIGIQLDSHSQELVNEPQIFMQPMDERPIEEACIFRIVYPQELNLHPACNMIKRGRPKKKKYEGIQKNGTAKTIEVVSEPPKAPRTRSGRLVKVPKYIEKDFKKIEIATDEQEIQISDFKRFEEKENTKSKFPELHVKKRVISAQYKCPKCLKAYLGKKNMIQHLKKNPDHGPLPEGYTEFNFDVWNYLFDITQKCKPGQKGIKFCEELSNLLHNVQLLKSALFKTVTDNKNCVVIDKVLGNAIGLSPGKYRFDENELYKDVTVLKLITNSEFFKPNKQTNKRDYCDDYQFEHREYKKLKQDLTSNFTVTSNQQTDENLLNSMKGHGNMYSFVENNVGKIQEQTIAKQSDNYTKKVEVDNQISLHSDLLADNLLLHSLANPRNPDEELMLTDNASNLLDNSTSSDEVMNVDQFVNERFKKIIEPDIELSNTSLNLDLPGLDLFHFHTS